MATVVPSEPFLPGEYLQDELDAREWKPEDLAAVTGITRRQSANIVSGRSSITPESAKAIGAAFDQDPRTWMNLQAAFDLAKANVQDRDIRRLGRMHELLPIREMRRRTWLPAECSPAELEDAVCKFLRISSLDDSPRLSVAARKSGGYEFNNPAQLAWYFRALQIAEAAPVSVIYDKSSWESGVTSLVRLAENPEDARLVPRVLADMGIRLVLLQHITNSKIDGAAFWMDSRSPVVALSLRYDRMDNFWFTLLHELVHIKHEDVSPVDEEIGPREGLPEMEEIANSEATSLLVPPSKLDSFIRRCGPSFQMSRVIEFARMHAVHPHIVAGQLRHRDCIHHSQLTKLNARVGEYIKGQALTEGWGDSIQTE